LQDYGFVRISTTHLFSKVAIKKAIQRSTNRNFSSKLFEDDSNDEKNQFVGFVSSHKKGHPVDILPFSQLCCFPY
jgi:hypothetical protein